MGKSNFTLTGTENLKRIFQQFPESGYRKPINAAFRKASAPIRKAMANELPSNLKPLKKSIRILPVKPLDLLVGFFRNKGTYINRRGQKWDPFQIVYWHNYGTLANRFAGHVFKSAISKVSVNKKGGIKPGLFVERAVDGSMNEAQKIFEVEVEKEITKFLDKEANK